LSYRARHRIYCWFALGVVALFWSEARGQQGNTFYMMHKVPQSNLLNPAVQAKCKWYVGIPGLASSQLSYDNSAFTYNDLAGSDTWNLEGAVAQMHRRDLYSAEASLQLISLGYRHRSSYFTFHISERSHAYSVVPGDLVRIAVNGNGPVIGETTMFRSFRPTGYYLREYALGYSRVIDRRLTAGIRGKVLFGKAGFYPGPADLSFHTDENRFYLLLEGDYTLRSSLPVTVTQDQDGNITDVTLEELQYAELLLNRGNPGLGIDLGILYRPNERTTLAASLLDVGLVRWRTDLNSVRTSGTFDYRGVDPGTDVVSFDYLELMIDSLLNSFNEEVTHPRYFSYTPAQLYLGGSYRFREHMLLGLVNRNVLFRSKLHSSVTFMYQAELAERFLATVSWSYLNNSLQNLGAGIAYYGRGFQFHAVSDNLLGFFFPFDTRTVNMRVGINLMLGCPRNKQEANEAESFGRMANPDNCGFGESAKKREKALKRAGRRIRLPAGALK
jgi:hypothetical protein